MAKPPKEAVLTFEQVFVKKLVDDPKHVLNMVKEYVVNADRFRDTVAGPAEYIRRLINQYLMPWIDASEENEELARSVLGHEIINLLRPC